jgi:integrase
MNACRNAGEEWVMARVRKRVWKTRDGLPKTAWLVDYTDQEGKRRFQTYALKKQADAALVSIQGEIVQGKHTPTSTSITVAEACDLWIARGETEKLERSTLKEYRRHAAMHIKPALGSLKLAKLTTPLINEFLDHLLRSGSRAMAAKILTSLKGVITEAQRRGLTSHNPALPVKLGIKSREQHKLEEGKDFPSKSEINGILANAGHSHPFLATAVFTGLRASELRGLRWSDIDWDKKLLHVRQRANLFGDIGLPKSRAGQRSIPIPTLISILKEWRLACPHGELNLVFPNARGGVESHTAYARGFERVQRRASVVDASGLPKYGLHGLRHFFASWAMEQSFTPKKLQDLMGHSSIRMTFDTYGHLLGDLEGDEKKFIAGAAALLSVV